MSTTTDEAPPAGTAVERCTAGTEEYRPHILMAPEEAKALDDALRENMRAVLHEGGDYGTIPGAGDKPVLLKPGAEKLLQWFGFGHAMERAEIDADADGNRLGVTYRCTVTKGLPDGRILAVAVCEGYAGYDEDRFYASAEKAEAKERAYAEQYKRMPRPAKFAEYRAPWNTVIKMAQKRAMVGAALQATSASSLFTQDIDDELPGVQGIEKTGRAAVEALPAGVQQALNDWYRKQGWPDPGRWDAQKWCAALIEAGRLQAAGPGAGDLAADDAQQAAPASQGTANVWLSWAQEKAATFPDADQLRELRAKVQAKIAAGHVAAEPDGRALLELIGARLAEMDGDVVDGVIVGLDPEDPWYPKVESVSGAEDAATAIADANAAVKAGSMSRSRGDEIIAAIHARESSLLTGATA